MRLLGRILLVPIAVTLLASLALSQTNSTKNKDEKTVQVGITLPVNQSRRMVNSKWTRDQLVSDLKRLQRDKKSAIAIEPVPVDSDDLDESMIMAKDNNWDYIVITRLLEPAKAGGAVLDPGGIDIGNMQTRPRIMGNTDPAIRMSIKFAIMRRGTVRPLAEGTVTVPDENDNDTDAANEAMRIIANRVANELRKQRSPLPE